MSARRTLSAVLIAVALIGTLAHAQTAPQSPPSAEARADYAQRLQRAFLSRGINLEAFSQERHDPQSLPEDFKKYPRLTIFGYLNTSSVFQIASLSNFLAQAKADGFEAVEFFSKGPNGRWIYDLSGPDLPRCDIARRLCL